MQGRKHLTLEEMVEENKLKRVDPSVKALLSFDPADLSSNDLLVMAGLTRVKKYLKELKILQKAFDEELKSCVEADDIEGVKKALVKGASANVFYIQQRGLSSYQVPVLAFALRTKKHEIAKLLIRESNVNIAELEKETHVSFLHCAVEGGGNVELINLLLGAGANVRSEFCGESPLGYAVSKKQYHLVDALSDNGNLYYKAIDNEATKKLLKAEIRALLIDKGEYYQALLERMNKEMQGVYDDSAGANVRSAARSTLIDGLEALKKKLIIEKDRSIVEKQKIKLEYLSKHLNVIQTRENGKQKTAMEKLLGLIEVLNRQLDSMVSGNPNTLYGPQGRHKRSDAQRHKPSVSKTPGAKH